MFYNPLSFSIYSVCVLSFFIFGLWEMTVTCEICFDFKDYINNSSLGIESRRKCFPVHIINDGVSHLCAVRAFGVYLASIFN